MMKRAILVALACAGLGGWTVGVGQSAAPAAATTEPATTMPASPAHAAAIEMLEAMNMPKVLSDGIEQSMAMQVRANPQMAALRPTLTTFLRKYMSWEAMKDGLADLYASEFTEQEMRELTAFYKSPLGQKVSSKTPVLTSKGMMLGQQRVQAHIGELQQLIQAQQSQGGAGGGDGGPGLPGTGPK